MLITSYWKDFAYYCIYPTFELSLWVLMVPQLSCDTTDILYRSIPIPIKVKVFMGMVTVIKKCTCGIPMKNPTHDNQTSTARHSR
jgi:hypothetical protein